MGQNRIGPTGENRSQSSCFWSGASMPHRVDALVDPVKSPSLHPRRGRPAVHAKAFELGQRHQPMLLVRDGRDFQVPSPRLQSTGRNVGINRPTARFVQLKWTHRPVGGVGGAGTHRPAERGGCRRACGARRVPLCGRRRDRCAKRTGACAGPLEVTRLLRRDRPGPRPRICLGRSGVCGWRAPDQSGQERKEPE